MSSPKTHLISCHCSADIPVSVGQAGDHVTCPACGREVGVPKLRDFGGLRGYAAAGSPTQTPWTVAHAVLLSGSVLAALAWIGSLFVASRGDAVMSAETIRTAVLAADDREVYRAWKQSLARSGVARPATLEEKNLQRSSRFSGSISRVLQAIGAVGAVAAAAAAIRLSTRRPAGNPRGAQPQSRGRGAE